MSIIPITLLFILIIFSYLDIKYRKIASVFLTGTLFVFATLNIKNMPFGILAFILAYLFYEFDFMGGVADIKLLTAIGFMLDSALLILLLAFLVTVIGAIYKIIVKRITKKNECAFIPCLTIIYVLILIIM